MDKKIIRLSQVRELTGLSKSSIYSFISKGQFPKSISLGSRSVGWKEKDVFDWIDNKADASNKKGGLNND